MRCTIDFWSSKRLSICIDPLSSQNTMISYNPTFVRSDVAWAEIPSDAQMRSASTSAFRAIVIGSGESDGIMASRP